jgi:aminopeptidase N
MVLTEGLATFAMVHLLEAIEGADAARRIRACTYPEYTWSGCETAYFRMAAAGLELTLASEPKGGQQTLIMHRMANTKGYYALEALSNAVGPEAFMRILQRILREHSGRALGWSDFKETIVRAAPRAREIGLPVRNQRTRRGR